MVEHRTGTSDKLIFAVFNLEREQMISNYTANVINAFEKDILKFDFGISNNFLQVLIDNNITDVAKQFYNGSDKLTLICDGTYAKHQNSSNNEYQRKFYTAQKKVPLYANYPLSFYALMYFSICAFPYVFILCIYVFIDLYCWYMYL